MDPLLHKAVTQGDLELLNIKLTADPNTLLSRTPQENTALHIAARLGHRHLAERILIECETLMLEKNIDGETPLHIASKFGKIEVADLLINYSVEWPNYSVESEEEGPLTAKNKLGKSELEGPLAAKNKLGKSEEEGPLTAKNKLVPDFLTMPIRDYFAAIVNENSAKSQWFCGYFTGSLYDITRVSTGNTALHEAVTHGKSEVALRLLEANPDVGHMLNEREESPLHIAAREGMAMLVKKILKQSWVAKEEGTQTVVSSSPLHQAVVSGQIKIVELLLYRRSDFAKQVDSAGNNALHYAASGDNAEMVEILITKDLSLVYANNYGGQPPLHVAVQCDSKSAIKAILKHCPDTTEQLGPDGGNALHVAVNKGEFGSLKCLLKLIQPEDIINRQDFDGNTPLHLAALHSRIQSALLLLRDRRVKPYLLNKKGQTARSVIEMLGANAYEMDVWKELKKQEAKRSKNRQLPPVASPRSFERKKKTHNDYFDLRVQTYTIVAALIASVTFATVFTVPGGYNRKEGFAILGKKPAFKPFVISNTIAMCSALVVVFGSIWAWRESEKFKLHQWMWGHRLTLVACLSTIVSLMTAVYLVVEPESIWLSIVVILIGCSTPIVIWLILGHEVLFGPS